MTGRVGMVLFGPQRAGLSGWIFKWCGKGGGRIITATLMKGGYPSHEISSDVLKVGRAANGGSG